MTPRWKSLVAGLALACAAPGAFAQATEVDKPDPVVEQRLKVLAEELRCLVCQNQTIADSNAPLALDLRNQIRTQVAQGKSDDQIRDYMVQRYGDFVLYKPPMRATTVLLWVGPFVLLLAGLAFLVIRIRRAPAAPPAAQAPAPRRADLEALLEGDAPAAGPASQAPAPRRADIEALLEGDEPAASDKGGPRGR